MFGTLILAVKQTKLVIHTPNFAQFAPTYVKISEHSDKYCGF